MAAYKEHPHMKFAEVEKASLLSGEDRIRDETDLKRDQGLV